MSTPDDQPPSPHSRSRNVKKTIKKLQYKHDLTEYIEQLIAFHAHHLDDILHELKERLMLQGLDEDDLHNIHEYLKVTFDGDLMKTEDRNVTQGRAKELLALLNT